ncbi:hypothetical protein V6C53_09345, partial [Desulfocurvibacter africanus]|uniref:hypothetical protein n=1 Tax=Desulfocurvibacter africanus TaxID=873 RepID=UPI002FD988BE
SMAATCGQRWRQAPAPVRRAEAHDSELEALAPVLNFEVFPESETISPVEAEMVETAVSVEPESLESSAPVETVPAESPETLVVPEMNQASETVIQPTDFLIKRLQKAVAARIKGSGLSQREWSKHEGVNARDVSLLLNHFDLAKAGKQTISGPRLNQFGRRFLNHQQAVGA